MENKQIEYRPSLAGSTARVVLPILYKALPRPLYAKIYELSYNSYGAMLRLAHAGRVFARKPFAKSHQRLKDRLSLQLLKHTMGGRKALENAFDVVAAVEQNEVPGALVECGVAQGGTAAMLAMTNRKLGREERDKWFFDSYEGLPEPTAEDYHDGKAGEFIRPLPKGSCLGTIEQVSELLFDELGFSREKTRLVKGWFQETVPMHKDLLDRIAVLRLDGDWYESTKIPLDNFYDKVSPGGYVIIDDYATCFGSRKAVDEFRIERSITNPLQEDGRGGVFFQKPN